MRRSRMDLVDSIRSHCRMPAPCAIGWHRSRCPLWATRVRVSHWPHSNNCIRSVSAARPCGTDFGIEMAVTQVDPSRALVSGATRVSVLMSDNPVHVLRLRQIEKQRRVLASRRCPQASVRLQHWTKHLRRWQTEGRGAHRPWRRSNRCLAVVEPETCGRAGFEPALGFILNTLSRRAT